MPLQFDSNGIITQNIIEILGEREEALKSIMGEEFTIDETTPIGNMELADANNELNIHELLSWMCPSMLDANTAEGIWLEAICEKNRIRRKQAEYTKLNLILQGVPKSSFLAGDIIVSDNIDDVYYELYEDCTIGEDGTVIARFKCESYGDYYPTSNATFSILTPVIGLNNVIIDYPNANISVGRFTESDEELRTRRNYSIQQNSANTSESIVANLYSLEGVKHVKYLENYSESTDINGLPMKSFECILDGGEDNIIANSILANKPVGTRAYGNTNVSVKDSQGNIYNIGFTKANKIDIGMKISIDSSSLLSETWKSKIKKSIKEKFDEINNVNFKIKDYDYYDIFTQDYLVTNINNIQFYKLNSPSQLSNQLTIGLREIAQLKESDITIEVNL